MGYYLNVSPKEKIYIGTTTLIENMQAEKENVMEQEHGVIELDLGKKVELPQGQPWLSGSRPAKRIIYPKRIRQEKIGKGKGKKTHRHLNFREITPPENRRSYLFPYNQRVIIEGPARIAIADSGNHRIETTTGEKFIVPTGWLAIKIETKGEWSF